MHATFRASNFRRVERLEWSPSGLCLLSGSNGSGKTTTLDVLRFLRLAFEHGMDKALSDVDGRHLGNVFAPADEPVTLEVELGEIRWRLRLPVSPTGLRGPYGEELHRGDEVVLRSGMFEDFSVVSGARQALDEVRCGARVLWDRGDAAWMRPLSELLLNIRTYGPYELHHVQRESSEDIRGHFLAHSGANLWSVLSNWKAAPRRYGGQFEWVMAEARRAFPDLITTIEFDRGLTYLYSPRATSAEQALPPRRAADGLLTGLLHLAAVAGARPGSIVTFDEVENQLHPHAIRSLLAAMRSRAEERDLTIVVTTHSPVVMNDFRDELDQVFTLERAPGSESVPTPITALHSEAWLAQARLGALYERLAFSAPSLGADEP